VSRLINDFLPFIATSIYQHITMMLSDCPNGARITLTGQCPFVDPGTPL